MRIGKHAGHCRTGKIRFINENEAKLALASCRGSVARRRHECRVYHCPDCNGWHLTSWKSFRQTIPETEYRQCLDLLKQDSGLLTKNALQAFRVANHNDPHVWRGVLVAAVHSWLQAGLDEELLESITTWYALRMAFDPGERKLKNILGGFQNLCVRLAGEYANEHETIVHPQENNPLAMCWVEDNCMRRFGVPDWLVRAAKQDTADA